MRNFRLLIEYDGTDFHGWQVQPEVRTVQGILSQALEKQIGQPVRLIGAGRTDAGVHAVGQTASFAAETGLPPRAVAEGTNGLLPPDVCIHGAQEVPLDFDARRSCRARFYRYTIISRRSPTRERYAAVMNHELDLERMEKAADYFDGERDFASFAVKDGEQGGTLCRVSRARWRSSPDRIEFEVEADRFLRGMVRAMVGTLLDVGRGRIDPGEVPEILSARDRSRAGPAAPARGLCLVRTFYPDDP